MGKKVLLKSEKEIEVRFNELDPLGVVWHGNYIKYFEDGREDFGRKYGISYTNLKEVSIMAPIVSVKCDYKRFVKYGEKLIIETTFVDNPAAKLILNYKIIRKENNELVAEGSTVQVFTDPKGELLLVPPTFAIEWKRMWGLLD
jgi:acyl-CoA thioester hydrolase